MTAASTGKIRWGELYRIETIGNGSWPRLLGAVKMNKLKRVIITKSTISSDPLASHVPDSKEQAQVTSATYPGMLGHA